VLRGEAGGLVEPHLTRVLVLAEYAVHGENVERVVGIEAGAEPLREGDGAEPCVRWGSGTRAAQGPAQRADQDPEHGARHLRGVVQERAETGTACGMQVVGRETTH